MYQFGQGFGRGQRGTLNSYHTAAFGRGREFSEMPPMGVGRGMGPISPFHRSLEPGNQEYAHIGPMGRRGLGPVPPLHLSLEPGNQKHAHIGPMGRRSTKMNNNNNNETLSGGDNQQNNSTGDLAAASVSVGNGLNREEKSIKGGGGGEMTAEADTAQAGEGKDKAEGTSKLADRKESEVQRLTWAEVEIIRRRAEEEKWKDKPVMKKDFYREDAEVSKMTDNEVNGYRLSRNNISVVDDSGNRAIPKPIKTFEQAFRDYPEILQEIYKQGFKEPSPIQCQVWPIALSGHDVIGIAQTGTGKTLAFLLPIFIHLDNQPLPRNQRKGPGCIILSPTRELALQIHSEIKKYNYKGIKSVCVYGGTSRQEQIKICTDGVDIVIATPGRLNDLVRVQAINLKTVTFLVLDEADRMLDMGFEPQIKKILYDVRDDRHTIMTSATWPPLVRELGKRYTVKPFLVFVGSLDLAAVHTVTQKIYIVDENNKLKILLDFLHNMGEDEKTIVFVGKKNLADHLSSELVVKGLDCQSLHGDRDQGDREQALADIKNGRVRILVATDLASRGLDIVDVTHVFNYDFPRNIEEYVHRVGRTGRAGRKGASITLISRGDWSHATELVKILEEADQEVPAELRLMGQRYEQKQRDNPRGRGRGRGHSDDYGGFFPSASGKKKW